MAKYAANPYFYYRNLFYGLSSRVAEKAGTLGRPAGLRLRTPRFAANNRHDEKSANPQLEALLGKLIAMHTTIDDAAANNQALDYIGKFVAKRGMYVSRHEWNGSESIVATARKNYKTPTVMLAAHIDVMPARDELFTMRETGGKLYGRGVLDMKFAIAAYLQIIDEIRNNLDEYDVGLMVTTDEETSGMNGTAKLAEAGYLPAVCILPDGGDNWQMQLKSKGFLYLTLSVTGKSAHGSRPWLGQNAILTLMDVVREVTALFPNPSPETNTINLGKLHGGEAANKVADYAEAQVDVRLIAESERQKVLDAIQKICKRHGADMKVELNGATCDFSLDNPYLAPFANIITSVTGVKIEGSHTLGSSDARYFAAYDVPCVSLYPPGGGHHGDDEWISKKSLHQFKEIVQRYLEQIAHQN